MVDVFKGVGVPEDEARICADVLISADKRGIDSHGVGRLKPIYYDRIVKGGIQKPLTEFEVVRDCKATAVVDGHDGMGMVVGKRCMQMAIDKAREHGLGMVVARNSTHYGFAAYYPLMAVEQGMVGVTSTNARPSIAPTFGVENMLGTNPLVFAMPTDEPFAFTNDYATSVIQRGKIEQWAREGKPCPEGLVINQDGESATDSVQILKDLVKGTAALAPIGGLERGDRRLQRLRLRHGGRAALDRVLAERVPQAVGGQGRRRQRHPHPHRPLLHGHRRRVLHRSGGLQEAGGRHTARAAGLQEGSRTGAHLHLRREGAPCLAGARRTRACPWARASRRSCSP